MIQLSQFLKFRDQWGRSLLCLVLFPLFASASEDHALYMTASLTQDFTIGKRVTSKSGLYVSENRKTAQHLGFHHPRMDKGDYDPRDPDVLYFAALNGVIGTRDGGQTWKILTSWNMTEGKDVKVDPFNPDRVIVGLPDGIGISEDQGASWRYSDSGIRRKYTQSICPDRSRQDHFLAGTEKGIFRTTDGLENWVSVLATSATVNQVIQSPHDPDVFLAATQENGAWLSRDSGINWEQVHVGKAGMSVHNVAFHPHKPEILTLSGWGFGVRVSEDMGETWKKAPGLAHDNVWSHAMDPDFPNRIYACLYRDTVHVSDDLGSTWEPFLFPGATIWDYLFVPQSR
jgi:photosystem II stability/assembly factor-like uncharacterized protein